MTETKVNNIPHRQRCVNKEHPYIGGAVDIIDDDLGLTQARINAIVLGDTISTDIALSKSAVFIGAAQLGIKVTATMSTAADTVIIYKKIGSGEYAEIARGSGSAIILSDNTTKFEYTDNDAAPDDYATITYKAEFIIGEYHESSTKSINTTRPVYYGAGANYVSESLAEDTTAHPAGSFDKSITTQSGDHLYFEIADNMHITSLQLVSTFNTPLAFEAIASSRDGYKAYRNTEERGAGTYTYRITIAND